MNIIQKGKRQLIILSVVVLILALGFLAGGIVLIVSGSFDISNSASIAIIIVKFLFGVIFTIIGLLGLCLGVVMVWTGGTIKAKFGNIAEMSKLNGTVNMKKCKKCGAAVSEHDDFCGICGFHLNELIKCPNCGKETDTNKKHCTHCGQKL